MTSTKTTYEITKPKRIIISMLAMFALVVGVHFFMTNIVIPDAGGYGLVIDIPSKTGSNTYYVDNGEFQMTSFIAIGAVALLSAVAGLMVWRRKYAGATALALLSSIAAVVYAAIMLGNGFNELWGGWWSLAGVLLAIGIGSIFQVALLRAVKRHSVVSSGK